MRRLVSTATRFTLPFLVAGALTCGGDGEGPSSTPTKLGIVTQPSAVAEDGVPFGAQPVVEIQNVDGQAIPSSGASVTIEVVETGGATLNGTVSEAVDAQGRATFTDLSLSGPGGAYTLRFTSTGLTATTSAAIVLSGASANASLTVTTQPPATALTGEVFDPGSQPAVRLLDASGNPMGGVTVTAGTANGSGTLGGGLTSNTDASGVATFLDLGITGTGAHALKFTAGTLEATSTTLTLSELPPEASSGKWKAPVTWTTDIVPLHMHLLLNGKILAWGRVGQPTTWDPSSGTFTSVAADTNLFCAGHALLPDGRLLVSGGHLADDRGLEVTHIFDPAAMTWNASALPPMVRGRWYPTVTTLPDGRLVTVAGRDTAGVVVNIPEVWNGSAWVQLPGASRAFPYYPRDFVAPDGRVFYAGELITSRWLDVNANGGTGGWTTGPSHIWQFNRDYGSAVMYDAGKILYVGGGGYTGWNTPDPKSTTPTATAEIIDLDQASPTWQSTGSMAFPRRHLNATTLPDGQVLATGGVSGGGFNDVTNTAVHAAELWSPGTNQWTTLAPAQVDRGYHTTALLLPDGRVITGGSGDAYIPGTATPYPRQANHEIFEPPYLFKGARPSISSAPTVVSYGETFQVNTPNLGQVAKVRFIRLGSVTHAFDQNTRTMTLPFISSVGGIAVTAPTNANLAPPGHYMLFLLNRNGVPSVGSIVKIQ
jgi:Domain of unknown function (DUF1929)/Glyoxal oxidase N-terminus